MDFHDASDKAVQQKFIDKVNADLKEFLTGPEDFVKITINKNGIGINTLQHGTPLHLAYVCLMASAMATAHLDAAYEKMGMPKEVFPAVMAIFMRHITANMQASGVREGTAEEFIKEMGIQPDKSSDKGDQK